MTIAANDSARPPDLREMARVIGRRRGLLIAPWVVALAIGIGCAFLLPPIYFSSVTLLIEQPQALAPALGGIVSPGNPVDQQAEIMRQQVASTVFLRSVVTSTGLKKDPQTRAWALRSSPPAPKGMSEDDVVENFLVNDLRTAITVKRDQGPVLEITVGDHDPERARRLTEGVANEFVSASRNSELEAARATQDFSNAQGQVYLRKLQDSEKQLDQEMGSSLQGGIDGPSVNTNNVVQARAMISNYASELEETRRKAASLKAQIGTRARENDYKLLSNQRVNDLTNELTGLERQLAAAILNSAPGADNTTSVRLLIARKFNELENELNRAAALALPGLTPDGRDLVVRYKLALADLAAKESGNAYLRGQVGGFERAVVSGPDRDARLQHLREDVENNRALYNSFIQQSASAQISEAFQNAKLSGRFSVLEPPVRPTEPGKPNRLLLILLSFVLGGILGVGSVLVAEHHDQSMKNAEEVESLIGLPVLGAVPRVEELERARRQRRNGHRNGNGNGNGNGHGAAAAAGAPHAASLNGNGHGLLHRLKIESSLGLEFRRIYLKLAKTRGKTLPHTLMVTSSTRGEGKTTTTACLGITLAREMREKVLLVDFDMRSPALHRALGLPSSSWGLAQMLQNRRFDERFVRATVLPHLDFLGAGRSERPASDLIDSEAAEWFMQEASRRYPLVVVDTAPNLAVPDSLMIGRAVEGVLYVIKAGSTIRKAAEYGVKVQREARDNVLGVLLNDVGDVLPHYYGYRYEAYGYTSEVAGGEG